MDDFIQEQIAAISNLKDRVLLKDLITGVFTALSDENEKRYKQLEQRVNSEINLDRSQYCIRTGIMERDTFDVTHHIMSPMLLEDLEKKELVLDEMKEALQQGEKFFVSRVFFKCDYLIIKEILHQSKRFPGLIHTDKKTYPAEFVVEQEKKYMDKIQLLYEVFLQNKIQWNTVNCPYIMRMLKVSMVSAKEEIAKDEEIKEVTIDFLEYQRYVEHNLIPVWNVKELRISSTGFPLPCEDHVNFEHMVSIKKYGLQNGYLAGAEDYTLVTVRRTEDAVFLTGNVPEVRKWLIYCIANDEQNRLDKFNYPIMENKRKGSFVQQLEQKNSITIKTKAELIRFLMSFGLSDYLELIDTKIERYDKNEEFETYPMNSFIIDELRDPDSEKVFVLLFHAKRKDDFLIRDMLSFLVSEVQLKYPEYKCFGKLI